MSSVTHELITPLRCIVNMTDQLFESNAFDRSDDKKIDKKLSKKIVMIRNTAKFLLVQINMTLDMSLLQSKHFTPIMKEVNLKKLCKATINLLQAQASMMNV